MNIDIEKLRVTQLKKYLVEIINQINKNTIINVNALAKDVESYSIDKIPTDMENVEKWIDGTEIHKDLYSFRSRRNYSYDQINNLQNIGFFEIFEELIRTNNRQGKLPNIKGIQSIRCKNCGTQISANTGTAEFDIQIQIDYKI